MGQEKKKKNQWTTLNKIGIVLYDFEEAGDYQLNLKASERVCVLKESSGWYKGHTVAEPNVSGIFPVTFIQLTDEAVPARKKKPKSPKSRPSQPAAVDPEATDKEAQPQPEETTPEPIEVEVVDPETEVPSEASKAATVVTITAVNTSLPPTPSSQATTPTSSTNKETTEKAPLSPTAYSRMISAAPMTIKDQMTYETMLEEIEHSMADWDALLKSQLATGNSLGYEETMERVSTLLLLRREVMDPNLAETKRQEKRLEIIQLIESSRKMQEGYMVPRKDDGRVADADNSGGLQLLELHRIMYQTLQEESTSLWHDKAQARRKLAIEAATQAGAVSTSVTPWPAGSLSLYLDIKLCIFSVGEATELLFSLYSEKSKSFITEAYCAQLTAAGMPHDRALMGKLMTIFEELHAVDFSNGLWLVCRIYRKGSLGADPKKKAIGRTHRRPFGCAAMSLSKVGPDGLLDKEYCPPNAAMTIYMPSQEGQFAKIHEMIIAGDKNLEPAPRAKGIAIGVTLFKGPIEEVRKEREMAVEVAIPTSKLKLPGVMSAGDTRNDFYIFLRDGHFSGENYKKKAQKNIEIIMRVLDDEGKTVKDAIFLGSGNRASQSQSVYHTAVYYHNNTPHWDEGFRLRLDPDLFDRCHLFFTFWHVSTKPKKTAPFSFGFLKLTRKEGAVISDETYCIPTYKPFERMENMEDDFKGHKNPMYLNSTGKWKDTVRKESFGVATILCSTKKTQNTVLYLLFKWQTLTMDALRSSLVGFGQIQGEQLAELAKFVRETFDALFGILDSDKHTEAHGDVLTALLHCLAQLTDKKLQQNVAVDSYINDIFHRPNVHRTLVRLCSARLAATPDESLKRLCKCLTYTLKFVVRSRNLDVKTTPPSCTPEEFRSELLTMLGRINDLLAAPETDDPKTNLLQFVSATYVIRSFPDSIDYLNEIFQPTELATVCKNFIESIPDTAKQSCNKLLLVRNLLSGPVTRQQDAREIMFPTVLGLLKMHLRSIDRGETNQAFLCISILVTMFKALDESDALDSTSLWQFRDILGDFVHLVNVITKAADGDEHKVVLAPVSATVEPVLGIDPLVDSLTSLWTLLSGLTEEQLNDYIASLSREDFRIFTTDLLSLSNSAISLASYPELWVVMIMLQMASISKMLALLSGSIREQFLEGDGFDLKIWTLYFTISFAVLQSEQLVLESFSHKKRGFIEKRYGDLRIRMAELIVTMWGALNQEQGFEFVELLVPHLFELMRMPDGQFGDMAIQIYFEMLINEHERTQSLHLVERHTIDALYKMANKSGEDLGKQFMTDLYQSLKTKFQTCDATVAAAGGTFLDHISKMHELMSSLLHFPDTAMYEDERTSVALKIIDYLKGSGHKRKEMFSLYAGFLVDLHVGLKNYVEAGITQLLQIRMLDWSTESIGATSKFPEQAEHERKASVYESVINYFILGEDYERAIHYGKILRQYYENQIFDFDRVASLLKQQASHYQRIASEERYHSTHFRVVFSGKGFEDDEIKGKEFVYRGTKLEPVMDFTMRLKRKFPDAKILMSSDAPSEEDLAAHDQLISITTLTIPAVEDRLRIEQEIAPDATTGAEPEEKALVTFAPEHPYARKYRTNNNIRVFEYGRADQRSKEAKPENEFKELWVIRTYMLLESSFPCVKRRCRVIGRKEVWLSPIENAVTTIGAKNVELQDKIQKVRDAPPEETDMGPLSMNLNGIIDAAVNGGTKKYVSAFLMPSYLVEHPDEESKKQQDQLKALLRLQIAALEEGLELFRTRCDEKLSGLAQHLTDFYDQMRTEMKEVLQ